MSDVSNVDQAVVSDNEQSEPKQDSVSYDSFQKVLAQRKADQAKAKQLEDELNAIKAAKSAEEEARLKENQEWRQLAERKSKELEQIQAQKAADEKKYMDNHKLNTFLGEVGGLKNPDYAKFIDYSKILVNDDGSINADSVKNYSNEFREKYSDLIKPSSVKPLPNEAPRDTPVNSKPVSEMSLEELRDLYTKST